MEQLPLQYFANYLGFFQILKLERCGERSPMSCHFRHQTFLEEQEVVKTGSVKPLTKMQS